MLGWILLGLAAVAVGVIIIDGIVTKNRIKEKMRERGIKDAIIIEVDNCENKIKLKDLHSSDELEIQGDELDYDIKRYNVINA